MEATLQLSSEGSIISEAKHHSPLPSYLRLVKDSDSDLMEKILLCLQNKDQEIWEALAASCEWGRASASLLRAIVLKSYNHPCGHIIIRKILSLNVIHLEDFEMMARNWQNANFYLTEQVMQKVLEVGRYCNRVKHSRDIASAIGNGGSFSWEAMKHYDE